MKRLITKLSKWTRIDLDYYIRQGFWVTAANIITALIGITSVVILSRLFDPDLYGQYRFFITVLTTLTLFSLSGMSTATLRAAAKGNKNAYPQTARVRFKYSLIGSLALVITGLYFLHRHEDTWFLYLIAAPLFPFIFAFDSVIFYLYGRDMFKQASIVKVILTSSPMLAVIALVLIKPSLHGAVLAYIITAAIMPTLTYIILCKKLQLSGKNPDKELVAYGKHISIMEAMNVIYGQIDKFILTWLLGFAKLAVYTIALTIPDTFRQQTKSVLALIHPRFSKQKMRFESLWFYIILACIGSLIVVTVGALLVPYVIRLFFTDTYQDAIIISQLLLYSAVFWIPALIINAYLESQKKIRELYSHRFIVPMIGVILYFVLIPLYGIKGAAYATITTEAISFVLLILIAKGTIRISAPFIERAIAARFQQK
jgi:O-antigen/teichoic acid export membrane protein